MRPYLPATSREWWFAAVGVVLAVVGLAVALPRYEVRAASGTLAFLRIDRWTGEIDRCSGLCYPVADAVPPPLDDGGFTEVKPATH